MTSRVGPLVGGAFYLLVALLIVGATVAAVPSLRAAALRAIGGLLIVDDPLSQADIGVMTESGEAGELEVSDLYHQHLFSRVIILTPAPTSVDREFARRGVRREDLSLTTLLQLGVPRAAITMVEAGEGGTTDTTRTLADWVRDYPCRVVVVVSPTHARRYLRTLLRVWPVSTPPPQLTYPRANPFRARDWWTTRRTLRDGIFELQRLAADYLLHPW